MKKKTFFRLTVDLVVAAGIGVILFSAVDSFAQKRGFYRIGDRQGFVEYSDTVREEPSGRLEKMGKILGLKKLKALAAFRDELNLSEEQKEELKAVLAGAKESVKPLVETVAAKRNALKDAVTAAEVDEAAIQVASTELGAAIGDAAVEMAKLRQQVHTILTDEQIEMIQQARQQRKDKRQERREAMKEKVQEIREKLQDREN